MLLVNVFDLFPSQTFYILPATHPQLAIYFVEFSPDASQCSHLLSSMGIGTTPSSKCNFVIVIPFLILSFLSSLYLMWTGVEFAENGSGLSGVSSLDGGGNQRLPNWARVINSDQVNAELYRLDTQVTELRARVAEQQNEIEALKSKLTSVGISAESDFNLDSDVVKAKLKSMRLIPETRAKSEPLLSSFDHGQDGDKPASTHERFSTSSTTAKSDTFYSRSDSVVTMPDRGHVLFVDIELPEVDSSGKDLPESTLNA